MLDVCFVFDTTQHSLGKSYVRKQDTILFYSEQPQNWTYQLHCKQYTIVNNEGSIDTGVDFTEVLLLRLTAQ